MLLIRNHVHNPANNIGTQLCYNINWDEGREQECPFGAVCIRFINACIVFVNFMLHNWLGIIAQLNQCLHKKADGGL